MHGQQNIKKPDVHHSTHTRPPLVPMLRHTNSIYSLPLYLFKTNLILRRGGSEGWELWHSDTTVFKIINMLPSMIINFHIIVFIKQFTVGAIMQNSPWWAKASSLSRLYDHTQTQHTRWDFSGRVFRPTKIPLRDNTQHWQETDLHAPGGIRTHNPSKRAATHQRFI